MNRRGFLQAILAAGVAPAVVGSGILMPIRSILLPTTAEVVKVSGLVTPELIANEASGLLEFQRRFLEPAMRELCKQIDTSILLDI